jgi:nitrous oxide reductase accessory protein NosL
MRRALLAALAGLLLLSGCSSTMAGHPVAAASSDGDRALVEGYFTELNASAADGPATQRDFLRRSQHPDFTDNLCDLGDLTLNVDPAMSTLRIDPDWVPPDAGRNATHPRGLVYVLGVSVSIRQDGAVLGEQIGSQRVVVLDGKAYGFAPCPTG